MQSRAGDSQTHLTWLDTRCLRCLKAWQSSRSCELCLPDWGWGCTAVRPASDCRQDRHQHWDRTGTTSCLHPANNLQSYKLPAVLLSIRVTLEEACHCLATVLPLSCHTADIQLALRLLPVPAHCAGHSDCHLPPSRRKYFMETLIVAQLHTTSRQLLPFHHIDRHLPPSHFILYDLGLLAQKKQIVRDFRFSFNNNSTTIKTFGIIFTEKCVVVWCKAFHILQSTLIVLVFRLWQIFQERYT